MLKLLISERSFVLFLYTASHVCLCGDRIILKHPACSVDQVLEWMVALPYGFIYIVALSSRWRCLIRYVDDGQSCLGTVKE